MQAPDAPEYRPDLWRLVALVGLVVWADDETNKGGVRYHSEEQRSAIEEDDQLAVFRLAQYIKGAGEWAEGTNLGYSARQDAADLPGVAFDIATGMSEPARYLLGEIISDETMLRVWGRESSTMPLRVFDAWAAEVRALSFRLTVACHGQRIHGDAVKPWEKHA